MKKYIVKYIDNDGDLCSVWVEADSIQDAKLQVKREYWDIKEIVSCNESR